jgi:transposase-like protein
MAQVEKMGGPYTKQEQEIRKNRVYELHFQQSYSAVQIAKMLDVNRNTINKDIQFWCSEIKEEQSHSNKNWFDKQLLRLESQRARLQESLVDGLSNKERLQIEKCITHIDLSIAAFVVKVETSKRYKSL